MDTALRDLFRVGGGWGSISGPGLFMTKAFLAGSVQAVVFGMTGATTCALFFGTAASAFIISASIGFAVGALGFYHDRLNKALMALQRYPLLMRLYLDSNFPSRRFDTWDERRLTSADFRRNWVMSNMLVASHISAGTAIERIEQGEEDAIVAHEIEKEAWKAYSVKADHATE